MENPPPSHKLQPPGAGLPWIEQWFTRYLTFPIGCHLLSPERAASLFKAEAGRILSLVRSIPPARRNERVLIHRITGIEDSSRHWSAHMVLEHLVIVDRGGRSMIESLLAGHRPEREVSIAAIKPTGSLDADPEKLFAQTVSDYLLWVSGVKSWPMSPRFRHPWFGDLRPLQWHQLLAFHHGIHRRQLERISSRLAVD